MKVWIVIRVDEVPTAIYSNEEAAQAHARAMTRGRGEFFSPDVIEYDVWDAYGPRAVAGRDD